MLNGDNRNMEFVGIDDWNNPIYKCIETNILWKDINCGDSEPIELYSCQNSFDGEPDTPIKSSLNIIFRTKYEKPQNSFKYQMLGRLKSDCDYYLGNGNRCKNHLWSRDEKEQICKMKELYNDLPIDQKPQWLTYEEILLYEKQIVI